MEINGTNISLVRGDTGLFTSFAYNANRTVKFPYVQGDRVFFTVKASGESEEFLFQKEIDEFTDGGALIEIFPEDTEELDYGDYVYDIRWEKKVGERFQRFTIVRMAKFTITHASPTGYTNPPVGGTP